MGLIIKIYDVEHGSCSHIITPNNKHILIEVGSKSNKSIVRHIKNKYFHNDLYNARIDKLYITHPHEDHIYDLPTLYEELKPKVLQRQKEAFDIVPTQNTAIHKDIADCANMMNREYNYPVGYGEDAADEQWNGGVMVDIIIPRLEWTDKKDLNTFSSIIVVKFQGYKFVFTGDNPKNILDNMIDTNYQNIRSLVGEATCLLTPHHGRTGEYSEKFFKCVNPYLSLVSDKGIEYGTQNETARLYKGKGVKFDDVYRYVLTTRNDGTVTIKVENRICNISTDKGEY